MLEKDIILGRNRPLQKLCPLSPLRFVDSTLTGDVIKHQIVMSLLQKLQCFKRCQKSAKVVADMYRSKRVILMIGNPELSQAKLL